MEHPSRPMRQASGASFAGTPVIRTQYVVIGRNGERRGFSFDRIAERLSNCCGAILDRDGAVVARSVEAAGAQDPCFLTQRVLSENMQAFRNGGVRTCDIDAMIVSMLVNSRLPGHLDMAARLVASNLQCSVAGSFSEAMARFNRALPGRLSPEFLGFVRAHGEALDAVIDPAYDYRLTFAGLRTMVNSYLLSAPARAGESTVGYADSILQSQHEGQIAETPQFCFMRVAAALACWFLDPKLCPPGALSSAYLTHLPLDAPEERWADTPELRAKIAVAFASRLYRSLARGEVTFGSPFFFNAGTLKARTASCFLMAVGDSIESIFAAQARVAVAMGGGGGIGIHWGRVRERGAAIRATGGESSGLASWLRILAEIRESVNQGGRRAGAVACFLPFYHPDVVEFLRLCRDSSEYSATGQHTPLLKIGLNVTAWFLERFDRDEDFMLVPPAEFPLLEELADPALWRQEFLRAQAVLRARHAADPRAARAVRARDLAREIFETIRQKGFPYMFFVDNANAQCNLSAHARINGSNLCCEVMIPAIPDHPEDPEARPGEDGVCVLGTVLTPAHLRRACAVAGCPCGGAGESEGCRDRGDGPPAPAVDIDYDRLASSAGLLAAALDMAIDLLWISPTMGPARRSLLAHRTIGVGQAGLVGAMHELGLEFESSEAVAVSAKTSLAVYLGAAEVSARLARLCGPYPSMTAAHHPPRGLLQPDVACSLGFLAPDWVARAGLPAKFNLEHRVRLLRESLASHGLRNAYLTSTQPTASNSIIHGITPGADVPNSMAGSLKTSAGTFYSFSRPLYDAAARAGLDADRVLEDVFQNDGGLEGLGLPADLERVFKGAFEVSPAAVVAHAAARQPFCSQAQSTNTNLLQPTFSEVMSIFKAAAATGLNTIYYTYGATETSALRVRRAAPAAPAASPSAPATAPGTSPNAAPNAASSAAPSATSSTTPSTAPSAPACSRDNPDCESCQG